jgi:hypothetical protein
MRLKISFASPKALCVGIPLKKRRPGQLIFEWPGGVVVEVVVVVVVCQHFYPVTQ